MDLPVAEDLPVDGLEATHRPPASLTIDDVLAKRLGGFQLMILAICVMGAFVDGVDRQSVGLTARGLASSLHLGPVDLGVVFAIDNLGAVIGAFVGGQCSDRFGRKPVLVWSMAIIAVGTLLTAFATSYATLAAIRFTAGFGLGSAIPGFLTLGSEYVSGPRRGAAAALVYVGYATGGAIGGLWTSYLLANYTWHSVFYVGALLPALVFLLAWWLLPESMQFLARMPGRTAEALAIAHRVDPALRATPARQVVFEAATSQQRGSVRSLFQGGLAVPTAVLWGVYLLLFATVKIVVVWLPSLLTEGGIPPASAALAQSVFFFGSITGELLAFPGMRFIGPKKTLALALIVMAVSMAVLGIYSTSLSSVMASIVFTGMGIGASTSAVIAATANLYGLEQRGVGIGAGMASSRFGQVISPLFVSGLVAMAVSTRDILFVVAAMPLAAAALSVFMTTNRARVPAAA